MDFNKLDPFIDQLLNSGAIKKLTVVEKEQNIVALINNTEEKLKATLASPEYYPGVDWPTIRMELFKRIGDKIAAQIKPGVDSIITQTIRKLADFREPDAESRQILMGLISKLLSKSKSRRVYGNIVSFIKGNKIFPFMTAIYNNKRSIYRGLMKFDEMVLKTPEEALDFTYTALMFLPIYDISLPMKAVLSQSSDNSSITLRDTEDNQALRNSFFAKIKDVITNEMQEMTPVFLNILGGTFYRSEDIENTPFASKFLKILYNLINEMDTKNLKIDKGADSFETSWLQVARTNFKYLAYDYTILDELYKITIEEGI